MGSCQAGDVSGDKLLNASKQSVLSAVGSGEPCDWSLIKRSICYTWIDLCTEGAVEFLFDETAHNHN